MTPPPGTATSKDWEAFRAGGERFTRLGPNDTIDGGDGLPGFQTPEASCFEGLDIQAANAAG